MNSRRREYSLPSPVFCLTREADEADSNAETRIGRAVAGWRPRCGETCERYGSKVYQLAFRYMKNREDAEEVTQDVLMKVVNKVEAFRGDAALSSWIYRITFNTAMSRLRNGKFTRPAEVSEHEIEAGREDGIRRA